MNNFNITQSQIGVLNTGSIQRIDAAITLSKGSDVELIGQHIRSLTESVIQSPDLDDRKKADIIDLTETLAEEVVGKRKPATIKAVMKELTEHVTNTTALFGAAQKLWEVLGPLIPK